MNRSSALQDILDTPVPSGIFAPHAVPGMPASVDRMPHQFLEAVRQTEGDVIPIRDGMIDGVPFPFFASRDPGRQSYVVVGFDTVKRMALDYASFAQDYVEHMEVLMGKNVIGSLDPPLHRKYRGLVSQAFGAQAIATLSHEVIEPLVDGLLDRIAARDTCDLVPALTDRLPVLLIGHIFDLPVEHYGRFASLSGRLLAAGFDWEDALDASRELETLFRDMIDRRRANPGDDIISRLIAARVDDEQLEDDDIISFCRALLPAGMETTARALSGMMTVLLSERAHWERLLANPDLAPGAVEELLRWNAPAQAMPKRPVRDIEIGGRTLPAGASLWVLTGHANRDPLHWERPHDYDMTRPRSQHLAFSLGPHLCLGHQLARRELEVVLRRMLDRLPDLRLDPDAAPPVIHGVFSRSADRVDVRPRG